MMEELLKQHGQEHRDLQSRITQKKKSATKKTRKGVNDECAELERQLRERHESELSGMNGIRSIEEAVDEIPSSQSENGAHNEVSLESVVTRLSVTDEDASRPQGKKPNRQKARLARRAAEQRAAVAQAAEEAATLPDLREEERSRMHKELEIHGLFEKDIRPDGHCLYSAVADQLILRGLSLVDGSVVSKEPDYRVVRHAAADFIRKNPDDFSSFLEEPLEDYVVKMRDTGEWGGQLELSALARAYDVNINVLQGDGRVEKIGSGTSDAKETLWLAYYRHSYGLGEHYNSLRPSP
ncbi:hypothetical protein MMC19_006181 [Ptychographa xylographoides]|nr:hypothetical protein [Ptychographa xylographoides]